MRSIALFGLVLAAGAPATSAGDALAATVESYLRATSREAAWHRESGAILAQTPIGAPVPPPAPRSDLRFLAWFPELDGAIASGGRFVGFESDLGFGDTEATLLLELYFRTGRWRFGVSGFDVEFTGDSILTRTITIGDNIFVTDTPVDARLRIFEIDIRAQYDLAPARPWDLFFEVALAYFEFDLEIVSDTQRSSTTEPAFVPFVGFVFRKDWGRLLLDVHVAGIYFDYDQIEGRYLDLEISLAYRLYPGLFFAVGYRSLYLDGQIGTLTLDDARLQGIYVGASFRF